jgi:hypothetical protein
MAFSTHLEPLSRAVTVVETNVTADVTYLCLS